MKMIRTITAATIFLTTILNCDRISADNTGEEKKYNITPISQLNRDASVPGSHFGETSRSTLELDYRSKVLLSKVELGWKDMHYPRVKKLKDGTFIMLYQAAKISANIFCAHSEDGKTWTQSGKVFVSEETVNGHGDPDVICYSSADCLVLRNGDILAFSPFRTKKGYKMKPDDCGIAMVRSRDGGHTWEDYQVIYKTQTWEPYAIELDSGEIQVYFTDSSPHVRHASAGVSLLRSFDGGRTWSQQCYISRKFKCMSYDLNDNSVVRAYCDQMPAVCVLADGKTKFLAMESVHFVDDDPTKKKTYKISFAWNADNWSETLTGDMTGPDWKVDHAFDGAAPYVAYFPSGEIVLSYNKGQMYFRVGNEKGDDFVSEQTYVPFVDSYGYWGSFDRLDDHSLLAVVPHKYHADPDWFKLVMGRLYLNHKIDVKSVRPSVDGSEDDWAGNTDALFVGSGGQAQCSFRFAQDKNNVYVLAGLLDSKMQAGDVLKLKFGDGKSTSSSVEVHIPYDGLNAAVVDGVASDAAVRYFPEEGFIAEVAISKKDLPFDGKRLYFNANIVKKTEGYTDGFTNVRTGKPGTWIPLVF